MFAMPLPPLLLDELKLERLEAKYISLYICMDKKCPFSNVCSASPGCVCLGTAEAGGSSHTNGADGVQPGSREEEDEAHPC